MNFNEIGLIPPLAKAVSDAGYTTPTPIQCEAIPPALGGRDILGCARTGTGKTAAFSLPVLQHIDRKAGNEPSLRALVLTPTRELGAQIGESFATYGKHLDIWHTVIFGGVNINNQIRELRKGVDVLVATPGRLLDLMGQGYIKFDQIELFILDEADRMLDMGFLPDVKRITAKLPKKRQTLFFSATLPPDIRQLAETLLDNPFHVAVDPVSSATPTVEQELYFVDKARKRHLLVDLLKAPEIERALVFSRTKHGANRIAQHLAKAGVNSAAIHGNKSQNARERALNGFRNGELRVMVATDLAARGIDIDGITHVFNYDLPNVPETYVHRIGRTGRAGATGKACSFCETEERPYLVDIERLIGQHIERVAVHTHPPTDPPPPMTDLEARKGRGGGPRSSGRPPSGGRPGQGRRGGRPGNGQRGGAGGQRRSQAGGQRRSQGSGGSR